MVYFITDGVFTKIGSAENVNKRLSELQIGNVMELSIIDIIDGGVDTEREAQMYFSEYFVSGEWYKIEQEKIYKFIKDFKDNSNYLLHSDMLNELKLSNFNLVDYKIWEYIVGLRKVNFILNYNSVSNICSNRVYFNTKRKFIELKLIIKIDKKDMYKINTKYIKNRV